MIVMIIGDDIDSYFDFGRVTMIGDDDDDTYVQINIHTR